MSAIFLSASIPIPGKDPYDKDSEPQIIQAAISALATVAMGRRTIVWGGHPAITPMMWASAQELGAQYANAVCLFQSTFFKDEDFPEENKHFGNVTYVGEVAKDLDRSLLLMRETMLKSQAFDSAVFIGGMQGIFDEYELFSKLNPGARCIVVAATGGASRLLANKIQYRVPEDLGPLDFIRLFYRELNISPLEKRRA
jgi:hypothetical protein